MSEEDSVSYKQGDVVWVKLGSCWWPAEVTEEEPDEDVTFRKPPLAVVKFFNEDSYEYIRSFNNIFPYNCERKNEFIKKGLDSFRANNAHMEKFPVDVTLAESKTAGNPNILSDPIFAPQRKSSIIAEVFGTPTPKKVPKEGSHRGRGGRPSTSKSKKPAKVNVTHRRFLGCDDYEAHIRLQYPGKDTEHLEGDEEISPLTEEPTTIFPCSLCKFETSRLEVMLFHVQCHIKNFNIPEQVKKKTTPKKVKKPRTVKQDLSEDDDVVVANSSADSGDESPKPKQKRKRRSQGTAKKSLHKKTAEEQKSSGGICADLLAEWSDKEDNDEETDTSKADISSDNIEQVSTSEETTNKNKEDKTDSDKEAVDKSCFDFTEEEEEDNNMVHTAVGRKIPRVIPPTDRRKSSDPDNEDASLPLAEDDENRMEILKVSEVVNENSNTNDDTNSPAKDESEFKDLMESTSVPELPDVPDVAKATQNFQSGKTIKFPDKPTEVATKLTNPKKRFVKSFEDFELLQNEQRKAMDGKETANEKVVEESKKKIVDSACGETKKEEKGKTLEKVKKVKTTEKEEKDKPIEKEEEDKSTEKEEKGKTTENTKKVEVSEKEERSKSVEKEVKDKSTEKEAKDKSAGKEAKDESVEKEAKAKTAEKDEKKVAEKEDVKKPGETKTKSNEADKILGIAKWKCQVMSKITDDEQPESPKFSSLKTRSSHRTPRSKILESYRNDTNEKKRQRSRDDHQVEEVVEDTTTKKEKHVSKKTKFLKFNTDSDVKKDVEESTEETKETVEEVKETVEEETVEVVKPTEVEHAVAVNSDKISEPDTKPVDHLDQYLNDFLFNLDKKEESPVAVENKADDSTESPLNEVHIKCAANDDPTSDLDIAIKTNLTNFSKSDDDMSGLTTLAAVSELKTNVDNKSLLSDSSKSLVSSETDSSTTSSGISFEDQFVKIPATSSSELVPIDGNLTVVSEKDLADGQVEITATVSPTNKKPVTLTSFSMDFSECNSDSASSYPEPKDEESKVEDVVKSIVSDAAQRSAPAAAKTSAIDALCDVEEHIPSQIVIAQEPPKVEKAVPSKLMERLTEVKPKDNSKYKVQNLYGSEPKVPITVAKDVPKAVATNSKGAAAKVVVKGLVSSQLVKVPAVVQQQSNKPIILSEKIIKPAKPIAAEVLGKVSVQKITSKRNMQDADEIDTFIIQKGTKTSTDDEEGSSSSLEVCDEYLLKKAKKANTMEVKRQIRPATMPSASKKRGKAKILQQTIITPAGEIIQPGVVQPGTDDNVFDINSMPIVLSDQILTPESIENMQIFLSDSIQPAAEPAVTTAAAAPAKVVAPPPMVKKVATPPQQGQVRILNKSVAQSPLIVDKTPKTVKTQKILGTVGSKIIKQNSFTPGSSSKQGKYVIVSQASTTTTPQTSRYTIGKKQTIIKRPVSEVTGSLTKIRNVGAEPSGNKIMILTNQQGQQQRVLLTPAQQKMMGYQNKGTKVAKTLVTGNIIQKPKEVQLTAVPGSSGLISKNIMSQSVVSQRITSGQTLVTSSSHVLSSVHPQQSKTVRIEKTPIVNRKIQIQSQKVPYKPLQQKTILIKNQHGQTVRKIQGTDDALLDQQVQEQIEAIKASGGALHQKPEILNYKASRNFRRSYVKKPMDSPKLPTKLVTPTSKPESAMPPLAPISPKKPEATVVQEKPATATPSEIKSQTERPLNQLVIQDAMGNQTTITEGQILALPSETIDGQPQSYMLVTLDESGNLTPLNNEALMSLDPNLGLGGDLGNTVLQIDQGNVKGDTLVSAQNETVVSQPEVVSELPPVPKVDTSDEVAVTEVAVTNTVTETVTEAVQSNIETSSLPTVNCSVSSDSGQQLIVTGDPIAAQKFLESLTEGNTDLANILASAEGSSILIHADGQQILINTDSDNQMLLSVNTDNLNIAESTEGGGNPIFATQPSKNQDILAAALADTDVFQQEQNTSQSKVIQSQLSPNSALYPMNVSNVLETSLTLNSPIMTPLEVPSTNAKKISDETDILSQVPKNVDLPITITDPNISQTVSQQQVASLIASELQTNLELSLPISDSAISVTSSDMNSPSFVYSLPNLDESVDINQKPFNSSMPLLTEDSEDTTISETKDVNKESNEESLKVQEVESNDAEMPPTPASFLDENEGNKDDEKLPTATAVVDDSASEETTKMVTSGTFLDETTGREEVADLVTADSFFDAPEEKDVTKLGDFLDPTPKEVAKTATTFEESESNERVEKLVTTGFLDESESKNVTKMVSRGSFLDENDGKNVEKMVTGAFLDETEGLCTLGGEMCSSLSEPPPDMFDLAAVLNSQLKSSELKGAPHLENKRLIGDSELKIGVIEEDDDKVDEPVSTDLSNADTTSTVTETSSPNSINEDSCEIPVQPEIVASLTDGGFNLRGTKRRSEERDGYEKKCKFD